jgi:hypothetical protein
MARLSENPASSQSPENHKPADTHTCPDANNQSVLFKAARLNYFIQND